MSTNYWDLVIDYIPWLRANGHHEKADKLVEDLVAHIFGED